MSYSGLADFLEQLGHAGQLARVATEVDPSLEIAEVTRRIAQQEGPALLFGSVAGSPLAVVTHLLGTQTRVCRALGGHSLAALAQRVEALVHPTTPEGWLERMTTGLTSAGLRKLMPKTVKSGPCQQVVALGRDVDLGHVPVLRSWPGEPGGTITAARLMVAHPETGRPVVGHHELGVLDATRLVACWHAHDEPARLLADYRRRNQRMAVAVVLGGDPAGLLAAMAPLPPGADAAGLAGLFREKPLEVVAGRTVPLEVPADAEMVLEGFIDPAEPPEPIGPRGRANGYYERSRVGPVIHVTALTHRANPIYPAMVPGPAPDEQTTIALALQQVFLPLVRLAIPELVDYWCPAFGAARHWALVSIRKTYAGQARRVAHAFWGLRQGMFAKLLVIVDEAVNVRDPDQVWLAVATQMDAGGDLFSQQGPPDPWDPATAPGALAYRVAIDATDKLPGERSGEGPDRTVTAEEVRRLVATRWAEYDLGPAEP